MTGAWCGGPAAIDGDGGRTVVCVKKVREGMPEEEWDETMPLPGDIIEAIGAEPASGGPDQQDGDGDASSSWAPPAKAKSELSSQLGRLNRRSEAVWVRVRRGDAALHLRARIAPDKASKLRSRFTIRAARDDRHVAVLADLTLDQCSELQERSRRVVTIDSPRFGKKGISYDWKTKVGTYLPDRRATVVSSILFMPFPNEHAVESTTTRSMAWFSAAVSSGAPLVFVNIQTEYILHMEKNASSDAASSQTSWRELSRGRQQSLRKSGLAEMAQGIRLWFLPGVSEVPVILTAESEEAQFGMDIKRTEEGFICISSVSKGSAADRAGLHKLHREASQAGRLVVISRLEGRSLVPSVVSTDGLILCCDQGDIKERLTTAIDRMEDVHLHVMGWPDQNTNPPVVDQRMGPEALLPPVATGQCNGGR